jgi:putative ABC transport system ATP-binding protein
MTPDIHTVIADKSIDGPDGRTSPNEALRVRELRKEYRLEGTAVRALDGVSLVMNRGEFVAVMGASGSGKSTLLHLIGGLDVPTSGSVVIEGADLAAMSDGARTVFRRRRLGVVFQAYNLLPTLTALENIALPALVDGRSGSDVNEKAAQLLHSVGLTNRAKHRPQAMSGGEQQRVAIARALMNDPVLLLADEPTGNLDSRHGQGIWRLLRSLVDDRGCTVLAVTHEAYGAGYADRVIVLKDGVQVGEIAVRQSSKEDLSSPSSSKEDLCSPSSEGDTGYAAMVATRYAQLVD